MNISDKYFTILVHLVLFRKRLYLSIIQYLMSYNLQQYMIYLYRGFPMNSKNLKFPTTMLAGFLYHISKLWRSILELHTIFNSVISAIVHDSSIYRGFNEVSRINIVDNYASIFT